MRPAQLSQQCCDNLSVRNTLGELKRSAQVLLAETSTKLGLEPPTKHGHNLRSVHQAKRLRSLQSTMWPLRPLLEW